VWKPCPGTATVHAILSRNGRRRFFRAFALASAKPKKERESGRKKSVKKSESALRERKKREFTLFPPLQSGNPVSKHKATRQGESMGLE
jgi:hypothetical protein